MADSASISAAFDLAFAGMCRATDFAVFEAHFGHGLEDLYRLYELAKGSSGSKSQRTTELEKSDGGKTALGAAWARTFRTHDLVEVTQVGDVYSDFYTDMYGVLVWRPRTSFTGNPDGEGRHLYYDAFLAGRAVLDTMRLAVDALLVVTGP